MVTARDVLAVFPEDTRKLEWLLDDMRHETDELQDRIKKIEGERQ